MLSSDTIKTTSQQNTSTDPLDDSDGPDGLKTLKQNSMKRVQSNDGLSLLEQLLSEQTDTVVNVESQVCTFFSFVHFFATENG